MTARPAVASPMRENTSADVLRRAQRGDELAFADIYHEHAPRLYATCLRLTGERSAANDVLQDTFVRAWDALPAYRREAALPTWLHRIAVNTALEYLRRDARRLRRVQPASAEDLDSVVGKEAHVAERLDLESAIAALAPDARTVFVLREIEGYSYAEISTLTGSSEVALRAQFARARRTLARNLER